MRSWLLVPVLMVVLPLLTSSAQASGSIEDYARYFPQTKCQPKAKPGTKALARWIERNYDGTSASTAARGCGGSGMSEHKEGRAIDWMLNAKQAKERAKAKRFLTTLFATDADGNEHALARRMGVMYVIWNDHIYASYDQFDKRDYLSSSCKSRRKCSATLRHRNHVHISLSRKGGRGLTSWF